MDTLTFDQDQSHHRVEILQSVLSSSFISSQAIWQGWRLPYERHQSLCQGKLDATKKSFYRCRRRWNYRIFNFNDTLGIGNRPSTALKGKYGAVKATAFRTGTDIRMSEGARGF